MVDKAAPLLAVLQHVTFDTLLRFALSLRRLATASPSLTVSASSSPLVCPRSSLKKKLKVRQRSRYIARVPNHVGYQGEEHQEQEPEGQDTSHRLCHFWRYSRVYRGSSSSSVPIVLPIAFLTLPMTTDNRDLSL